MNKATCRKIAKIIKNEDILEMFKTAKERISDWTVVSRLNPCFDKGFAWNLFASHFDVNKTYNVLAIQNMLVEFGEWLTIKPYMEHCMPIKKQKPTIECYHQEPNFENY